MPDIPAPIRDVLRSIVGLDVDPADSLHVKLAETIRRLGPGATYGQRIVALRFDFAWELRDAGKEYGQSKADYEDRVAVRVTEIVETAALDGKRVALGLAEYKAQHEAYELKLAFLVAEQRERAMRKFLDAMDAALENHRTDRADARAGDRAHADGFGGGA